MITVVHLITGLVRGGAETTLARLVTRMDPERFHNVVISMRPSSELFEELAGQGVEMHSLGMRHWCESIPALPKLRALIAETRPQVLQTWLYHADLFGTLAAAGAGTQLVWNLRNSEMGGADGKRMHRVLVSVLARLSRQPAAVIANSHAAERAHSAAGYRPKRWVHVPNGYDTDEFRPCRNAGRHLRAELELPRNTLLIGHFARFDPMKDHGTFFAAAGAVAKANPRTAFVMGGCGITSENAAIQRTIAENGLAGRVHLLGERKDMPQLLAGLDMLALSSTYGESFPNVVAEAMACGVPVVATDVGDTARMLKASGVIVPPRAPDELARALTFLCGLEARVRRRIGAQGRQVVHEHFAIDRMVRQYEDLYTNLVVSAALNPARRFHLLPEPAE
jgi:glycosyltransferase involved in cell wall biosynthesis